MTKYVKSLQLIIVSSLIALLLSIAVSTTIYSYESFYYPDETVHSPLLKLTRTINNFTPIAIFEHYTGFNTGYGFFAPNVASSFVFIHKIYNSKEQLVSVQQGFTLNSKEGLVRFSTLQTLFLEKLKDKGSDLYNTYLDIIAQQLSTHVLEHYPPNYRIETVLYLYDYPRLKELSEEPTPLQPKLIKIKCYSARNTF